MGISYICPMIMTSECHVLALAGAVAAVQISIASTVFNDLVTPLGVDNASPNFGWSIGGLGVRHYGNNGNWQHSTYIHDGTGSLTSIHRHFYYGFRSIELTGIAGTPNAATVAAQRLHSDVRGVGCFTVSDDILTWIHGTTWQSVLSNIVGVPTDGAYLEKLPWLSDAAVMSETMLSSLNVKVLYTKWAQDIKDSALADGNLPPWALSLLEMDPFPSPTWGNTFPEVVWQLYQHSGDVDLLSLFYELITSYLVYELNHRNSSGLIGLESWGDWVTPSINDKGIVGTAHLCFSITRVIQMASILDYSADIESCTSHAAAVNSSFYDAYYQPATGDHRSSSTGGVCSDQQLASGRPQGVRLELKRWLQMWFRGTTIWEPVWPAPAESSALISLPVSDGKLVYENGKTAVDSEGVEFVDSSSGKSSYNVTSGTYNSVVK
ncbi:hypothetical protein CGLO_07137 [Colletotrichum gloeosporioides Cg-14]|uniref:alpha-L-rhamnosidase n=1 Tax=Colletotrichum gloeosporioides (strain Cg-14) TaxID=1237896 RepID=T0KCM9_COLGC|nr:hypothetical protein CGLO_07137 [Colletotrichum gloeosporioides Cg-14]